jgi:hypothetical protein
MTRPTNRPIKQSALLTSSSSAGIPSRQSTLCHEHGRPRLCACTCACVDRPVVARSGISDCACDILLVRSIICLPQHSGLQRFAAGKVHRRHETQLLHWSGRRIAKTADSNWLLRSLLFVFGHHGPGERVADYLMCLEMYMYSYLIWWIMWLWFCIIWLVSRYHVI